MVLSDTAEPWEPDCQTKSRLDCLGIPIRFHKSNELLRDWEQDAWKDTKHTHVYQQTIKTPKPDAGAISSIGVRVCVSQTTIQIERRSNGYRMDHGTILDLIHFGILFVLFLSFDVALDVAVIWSYGVSKYFQRRNKNWPIDRRRKSSPITIIPVNQSGTQKHIPTSDLSIHASTTFPSLISFILCLVCLCCVIQCFVHIYTSHKSRNRLGNHSQRRRSQSHSQYHGSIMATSISWQYVMPTQSPLIPR